MFFNNSKNKLKTALSKYIWDFKDKSKNFCIDREILARTKNKFNLKYGCILCNTEIHEISKLNPNLTLNKQNWLFSNCKNFSSFCFELFLNICANSVCFTFFYDMFSDVTILGFFLYHVHFDLYFKICTMKVNNLKTHK